MRPQCLVIFWVSPLGLARGCGSLSVGVHGAHSGWPPGPVARIRAGAVVLGCFGFWSYARVVVAYFGFGSRRGPRAPLVRGRACDALPGRPPGSVGFIFPLGSLGARRGAPWAKPPGRPGCGLGLRAVY